MATFTVLDQADEDKLHATRLLGIEERPFKRLTKRILAPTTPIHSYLALAAASESSQNAPGASSDQVIADINRFRDDLLLDFAAFTSSIARIQFLRAANVRERERYADEKFKIEATAQDVRNSLAELRVKLEDAQQTLKIRKAYDVLAERIAKEGLKPRDEQRVAIEKLRNEIEELKAESADLDGAWVERREQVGRVIEQGMRLRRLIRDEKEPEAGEDGDKDGEDGADGERDGDGDGDGDDDGLGVRRERDGTSNAGTPRPGHDAPTPFLGLRGSAVPTPRDGGEATPLPLVNEDVEMGEDTNATGENSAIDVSKAGEEMDTT